MSRNHFDKASEWELLKALNAGSGAAFALIYKRFQAPVYYFACRFVDAETAEDITAEAFEKLWRAEARFEALAAVKTFLQKTAPNACLDRAKTTANRHSREAEFMYALNGAEAVSEIRAELLKRLMAAIEQLPPRAGAYSPSPILKGRKVSKSPPGSGFANKPSRTCNSGR